MATMGLIMAEASKALSTVITPAILEESSSPPVPEMEQPPQNCSIAGTNSELPIHFLDDTDDEDSRSFSSTRASSIASHRSILASSGIQLTFLPEEKVSTSLTSTEESSTTTLAASSFPSTSASSLCHRRSGCGVRHPIRVSFVPIDLDVPLQEQHGGKFDVILHKMTEDILCISKLVRWRRQSVSKERCIEEDNRDDGMEEITKLLLSKDAVGDFEPTRHQERAARRIQRLNEYKVSRPSCVLVDSPKNILAVMSRADMARVLLDCLEGVKTKMGIPVNTPRFRVVEEGDPMNIAYHVREMEEDRFSYPLIAKPLTAAGTKSSHHMGIVMARDGLTRLKPPCILQEFANHGGQLFKVYVLGESVWVFSRESLPNLPPGENELPPEICGETRANSYVEFERPAGSRCYVEFNSQRPYPTLSDFGIGINDDADVLVSTNSQPSENPNEEQWEPRYKRRRVSTVLSNVHSSGTHDEMNSIPNENVLANYVTKEQIEPVTNKLREAFGLELFGFDILVKHDAMKHPTDATNSSCLDVQEILVVDVNYFPGYKEVPHFPSLLAQYLTQKAVETRIKLR